MLKDSYFKTVIDNLSTAVLLGKPLYNEDGKVHDFEVQYINDSFIKRTKNFLKEG